MKRSYEDRLRLAAWRQGEGLTLAEVSALTGLSVAMLSLAERGERSFLPKTKVLIARRLNVPLGELFELVDDPVPAVSLEQAAPA
jgi:transcriptional regulator with XRE-family HTH domain